MTNISEFYKFSHGQFDIDILSDGPIQLAGELFAPEASPEQREEVVRRLDGADNSANAQSNTPLIRTRDELILVDVGAGTRFQPSEGKLEENLKKVGVSADDVTIVVISHAHPDHIWGLLREDGTLRFRRARYFVGRTERDFWMGEAASALPEAAQPFVQGARRDLEAIEGKATYIDDGDEVVAGFRAVATPGHTPGHLSFVLDGEVPLIITADAIASEIVAFEHPEWSFGFDMDAEQARKTRRLLLDRASEQNAKLIGFHWTYPGVGSASQAGEAYTFKDLSGVKP